MPYPCHRPCYQGSPQRGNLAKESTADCGPTTTVLTVDYSELEEACLSVSCKRRPRPLRAIQEPWSVDASQLPFSRDFSRPQYHELTWPSTRFTHKTQTAGHSFVYGFGFEFHPRPIFSPPPPRTATIHPAQAQNSAHNSPPLRLSASPPSRSSPLPSFRVPRADLHSAFRILHSASSPMTRPIFCLFQVRSWWSPRTRPAQPALKQKP